MSLFEHHKHPHHIANVNDLHQEQMGRGDRWADAVASYVGSWNFIILMSALLFFWILLNSLPFLFHWDPGPFILLNLCLSFMASYTAPFILMSSNRQAAKDRLSAEEDYQINRKGEHEIEQMIAHLDQQDAVILRLEKQNGEILQRLEKKGRTKSA